MNVNEVDVGSSVKVLRGVRVGVTEAVRVGIACWVWVAAAPAVSVSAAAGSAVIALADLKPPPGIDAAVLAQGEKVFRGQAAGGTCTGCHGSDGRGTQVGPDLTDATWLWSDGNYAGIKGADVYSWQAVAAPKGLPADIKAKLHAALVASLNDPAVKPKLLEQGFEIVATTPEQFAAFQAAEFARCKKVIETGKITAD